MNVKKIKNLLLEVLAVFLFFFGGVTMLLGMISGIWLLIPIGIGVCSCAWIIDSFVGPKPANSAPEAHPQYSDEQEAYYEHMRDIYRNQ